jgi:hypothetical protein
MISYGTKLPTLNDPDSNVLILGPVSSYKYIALGVIRITDGLIV